MTLNENLFESVKDKIKNMSDEEREIYDSVAKEIGDMIDKEIIDSLVEEYEKNQCVTTVNMENLIK